MSEQIVNMFKQHTDLGRPFFSSCKMKQPRRCFFDAFCLHTGAMHTIPYHTMLLPFCGLRNAPPKSARIGRRFRITSCRTARSRFRTSIQCGWCGCWTLQQIPRMEYHIPKICFPSRAVKNDKGACIFQSIAFEIFPYFRPATVPYCFYKSIIFEMQSASNCSLDFPACTRCWLMPMKHVHTFPRSTAAPHFTSFHHSQMTPGYQVFHQRTYYLDLLGKLGTCSALILRSRHKFAGVASRVANTKLPRSWKCSLQCTARYRTACDLRVPRNPR